MGRGILIILLAAISLGWSQENTKDNHNDFPADKKEHRRMMREFGDGRGEEKEFPPTGLLLDERFSKIVELAAMPEDQIGKDAKKWKRMKNMPDGMQDRIMGRAKRLRKKLREGALEEAKTLGITLDKEKEGEFIRAYWQKRADVEKKLKEEFEPRKKTLNEEALQELRKQFSSAK